MDHIAIMKKSWGLLGKIRSGEKTMESRWYRTKRAPWGRIARGDTVYFCTAGGPVELRARVQGVAMIDDLTPQKVEELLRRHGGALGIAPADQSTFLAHCRDTRYCILIDLTDIAGVSPFFVEKAGFGMMSAWITVENIAQVRAT